MVKNLLANAGDVGPIPGWRRKWQLTPVFLPGESMHVHAMDRGAWRSTVQGVTKS